MLLETLRADGLLSFAPGTPALTLRPLNVVIGPNGSGKSNLLEVIELLRAAPTSLASALREGGGVREWLWKGDGADAATIEAHLARPGGALRYRLGFAAAGARPLIVDEAIEDAHGPYFDFAHGSPFLSLRLDQGERVVPRALEGLNPAESVLSQRKDPDQYPELTWCAQQLSRIQLFREWGFGRATPLRVPQPADLPSDVLLPDARNLGLILNQLEHSGALPALEAVLRRFLPRFQRLTTLVQAGTVQFFLREDGFKTPIPATRLSDGTLRFLAMAAVLVMPEPPPLVCLEEPELGLHPDAMALVAELLVTASARTQVIVTTHSDALVSALSDHVDAVLVCEYRGGTRLSQLDAAQLTHWLDRYRLGDLWRMGELGGNP